MEKSKLIEILKTAQTYLEKNKIKKIENEALVERQKIASIFSELPNNCFEPRRCECCRVSSRKYFSTTYEFNPTCLAKYFKFCFDIHKGISIEIEGNEATLEESIFYLESEPTIEEIAKHFFKEGPYSAVKEAENLLKNIVTTHYENELAEIKKIKDFIVTTDTVAMYCGDTSGNDSLGIASVILAHANSPFLTNEEKNHPMFEFFTLIVKSSNEAKTRIEEITKSCLHFDDFNITSNLYKVSKVIKNINSIEIDEKLKKKIITSFLGFINNLETND